MAKQSADLDDAPKRRHSVCGCIGCFLIWLFPICLALGAALFFSPNDRVKDIAVFNKRAGEWMETGYDEFKNATFIVCIDKTCTPATFDTTTSGELYPTGDKCDKEGDPEGGCVSTVAGYFTHKLQSVSGDVNLSIYTENSKLVVNETISFTKSKKQLSRVCYRVRDSDDGYQLDVPPTWYLRANPTDPGCYFGNAWEPAEYQKKTSEEVVIEIRSYQDPFIAASSLTRGCNENEKNSGCFGITSKEMKMYGLYAIIVTGAVSVLELLILLSICCCCRYKLPCCNKDDDDN